MKAHFKHPFLLYVHKRLVVSEVIDDDCSLIPLSFKVLYSSNQLFLLKRLGQWSNPKDAIKWFESSPRQSAVSISMTDLTNPTDRIFFPMDFLKLDELAAIQSDFY